MKKFASLFLALTLLCGLLPATLATAAAEEPTVIRWGTHWVDGDDPHKINETTGEYTIGDEADRLARIAAEEAVLKELNVKIEYVQYAQDTRSEIMLSVLAGNPVCDLAVMWNGSEPVVLAQNVLQPLDDYAYIFADGGEWMFSDKVYGHNYFLNKNVSFNQYFTLLCNVTMLQKVDTLPKNEDGSVITPMQLLAEDKWDWSHFTDYLTKIQAYYANTPAPDGAKVSTVQAYESDYRFAAMSLVYANGGAVYGANGLSVDAPETIEAVQYVKSLLDAKLMVPCGLYDDGWVPQWCESGYDFGRGSTVFGDCPIWVIKGQVDACTARGESVAVLPWPRPDDKTKDDPTYRQVISVGDCIGVPKGLTPEKTELALKTFRLYWETYYNVKGGVNNIDEYKTARARDEAIAYGLDIYNEQYGQSILDSFIFNASKCVPNDFAGLLGMRDAWDEIVGKGFMGVGGMQSYDVAVKANMNKFSDKIAEMEAILGSDEINDNQAPEVTVTGTAALPLGSDLSAYDWTQHFTAKDGVDGVLDPEMGEYNTEKVDVNTVGTYKVKGTFADAAGNTGSKELTVVIYDGANTTAPTLVAKAELPTIAMDSDVTAINWANDYVETATDANGLDLKDKVTAVLDTLDTTSPDSYDVTLTVTDYAGNTTEIVITVEVVVPEE